MERKDHCPTLGVGELPVEPLADAFFSDSKMEDGKVNLTIRGGSLVARLEEVLEETVE